MAPPSIKGSRTALYELYSPDEAFHLTEFLNLLFGIKNIFPASVDDALGQYWIPNLSDSASVLKVG